MKTKDEAVKIIVTGGAGFIGSNVVYRALRNGNEVVVVDNLARSGTEKNLKWLKEHGLTEIMLGDLANKEFCDLVFSLHRDAQFVLHLAGQVAVTSSITDPRTDYENNIVVGFNVLEGIRRFVPSAVALYSSTNKVYGSLEGFVLKELDDRYELEGYPDGIDEQTPLDFHSPYGVSKGALDQYFHDYARIYGLKTIVCRQSCIYGTRQFGNEDQGWVAWFMLANLREQPITIYGNGKQVRDLLWIDDLIDLYEQLYVTACGADSGLVNGKCFNIGGGRSNAVSIMNMLHMIERLTGKKFDISYSDTRSGDQGYFVADMKNVRTATGWTPQTGVSQGLSKLFDWIKTIV